MKITKSDVRKIKNATKTEIEKLKAEYEELTKNIHSINNTALILLCVISVAVIFYFRNSFFEFIGFILFVYAFYTLSSRIGHREGYLDGYYEASHQKENNADAGPNKETGNSER